VKESLNVHEVQRYAILHNVNTDIGRGRAWLRASLNERTLERALLRLTSSRQLLEYVSYVFVVIAVDDVLVVNGSKINVGLFVMPKILVVSLNVYLNFILKLSVRYLSAVADSAYNGRLRTDISQGCWPCVVLQIRRGTCCC